MADNLRVLMITSEWPVPGKPYQVPFIVRQVNYLRKAGIELDVFPFRGAKNPVNYLHAWWKARQVIHAKPYDLIHAQWGQSGLMALPKSLPLVVTFRGDDLEGISDGHGRKTFHGVLLKTISRLVASSADQVILVSKHMVKFINRQDFHIIPSGLELDRFFPSSQLEARRRLGLSNDKKYVLFAGSVNNPNKRFLLARQAVDILKEKTPIELLVATDVTHDQMPDYMNASDALLLTSLHEGSPNVVKEALACNLPVVSTDVGDVRQRIESISGCAIIENDTPENIAIHLRNVLLKGGRIQGRETVLDLDEKILTEKVIQVYLKVLSHK